MSAALIDSLLKVAEAAGNSPRVVDISADALQDERGVPYFRVRLEAEGKDFGPGKPITPGMLA